MNETVFLVKFDRGYYAAKQPYYHWSYTDDPSLAKTYKTHEKAKGRGVWGTTLVNDACRSYVIEQYVIKTTMEFVK